MTLAAGQLIEGMAPVLLAIESGAFDEANLDVKIEPLPTADALPQIAQRRLDGQMTSFSTANFNMANSGMNLRWVMPLYELPSTEETEELPGYWANIRYVGTGDELDLSGLKGQLIATPVAPAGTGAGAKLLEKSLTEQGMTLDDVKWTVLSGADSLASLENGAVAAAWLSQPFERMAAKDENLRLLGTYEPGVNGSALLAGPSLGDRPEVLKRFMMVVGDVSEKYLQGNYRGNPETVRLLAAALDQDEASLREGVPLTFDPTLSMDGADTYVEELQEWTMAQGNLEYDTPVPTDRLVDTETVAAAAACRQG
ncbi:hypothetical protein NXT08_23325 (plasmid) [Rhodococcus pyridinivorans]|uniref:ABC transporter substrate-binding protein n=1 Tax=Rhodococcus TaxID=1827 RepID=UPI0007DA0454|nr:MULTISPECIES: hypothetical protein [Rhodococcus]MCT7293664.1 hypothetical protein [Rhodococcus sp. PAE-6]QXU56446.1 hypothetical protein KXC42_25015 [Rhodococcus sp. LW-XY12]UQB75816.1 hypothetical protein KI427_26690 [Rhodococcus ruber]UVT27505.1 hypothetical protein NXT08_23325 [Rhodococcus pyridinivorans]WML66333.1 hypothetical protein QNA09_29060 [Rhodococcus sp. AH-ZY2]